MFLLACRFFDLGAPEVALLVHPGDVAQEGDTSRGHLLHSPFGSRRVQLREKLVPFEFRLLLGQGTPTVAGPKFHIFPERLDGAVRLHYIRTIAEDPWIAWATLPLIHSGMLNSRLHPQTPN
jgi:hypothetical protein